MRSKHCRPLETLKEVLVGGQKFNVEFLIKIQKVFPNAQLITGYGSTEIDLVSLSLGGLRGNSSGQVSYNYSAKVARKDFFIFQNILETLNF